MYFLVEFFEKVASKYHFLGYAYKNLYTGFVENEIKAANITKEDKVVHVGCGSLPYTSLIIAEKTGAKVTAIDIDPVAVERARSLTSKDSLLIQLANAEDFDFAGFDIVFVSFGVKPKDEIQSKIYSSLKPGGKMVTRKYKGILNRLFGIETVYSTLKGILVRQSWFSFRESFVDIKV